MFKTLEWTEEGVRAAQKSLEDAEADNTYDLGGESVAASLSQILLELKRGVEAETALMAALSKAVLGS